MKRLKLIAVLVVAAISLITGCTSGDAQNNVPDGAVKYEILLNTGSCFVYTFQDPETGVWYLSTSEGVFPRLGEDGGLYNERD